MLNLHCGNASKAAIDDPSKTAPDPLTDAEVNRLLRNLGITKQQVYRWRKLAELSEEEVRGKMNRRFRRYRS